MLKEKVESALNKVRPSLQADGGDVQLIDVDDQGVGCRESEAHGRLRGLPNVPDDSQNGHRENLEAECS